MEINVFDLAVVVIIATLAIKGVLNGFLAEVAGLVGLLAGLLLARAFFQETADLLRGFFAPTVAPAVAFIGLVLIGLLAVVLLTKLLQRLLDFAFIGWLDHTLGLGAGAIKGVLLCALVAYIALKLVPQFETIRSSYSLPYLREIVIMIADAVNIKIPMPW